MNDYDLLLTWIADRGEVTASQIGDSAPRKFRRAADHRPLLAELVASGRIIETSAWPRTFQAVRAEKPTSSLGSAKTGAMIRTMLDEAAAEFEDLPEGLARYWTAITVRDRLVERLRVRNRAPVSDFYSQATAAADEAVTKAFGVEMEG